MINKIEPSQIQSQPKSIASKLAWLEIIAQIIEHFFDQIPIESQKKLFNNLESTLSDKSITDVSNSLLNDRALKLIHKMLKMPCFQPSKMNPKLLQICLNTNKNFDLLYEISKDNIEAINLIVKKFIQNIKSSRYSQLDSEFLRLIAKLDIQSKIDMETKQKLIKHFLPEFRENNQHASILNLNNKHYLLASQIIFKLIIEFDYDLVRKQEVTDITHILCPSTKLLESKSTSFYSNLIYVNSVNGYDKPKQTKKNNQMPNMKLFAFIIDSLVRRSQQALEIENLDLIFSEFLLNLNVLFFFGHVFNTEILNNNELILKFIAEIKNQLNFVLGAFYRNTDQMLFMLEEILYNVKANPFYQPGMFCSIIENTKLVETCLKVLELALDEDTDSSSFSELKKNSYLVNLSKNEYLQLITFTLLSVLSIECYNMSNLRQLGQHLKIKLFKYVNSNRKILKFNFLVTFLNCFKSKNSTYFMLSLNDYEFCMLLFDQLFSSVEFKSTNIDAYISLMHIYNEYSLKLLSLNSHFIYLSKAMANEEANNTAKYLEQLNRAQDYYIKIAENYLESTGENQDKNDNTSLDYQLALIKIQIRVLEIFRFKSKSTNNKRDMVNYFNKFMNTYLSSSANQSNIVKLEAVKLIVSSSFQSFNQLYTHYLFDYVKCYSNSNNEGNYLECLEIDHDETNQSDEIDNEQNIFFDKLYSNMILNNNIFENTPARFDIGSLFCEAASQPSVLLPSTNSSTGSQHLLVEKYNNFKKAYSNFKKQLDEPLYLKYLIVNFFRFLLHQIKHQSNQTSKSHKFTVKCLFGLIHMSIEHQAYFDSETIKKIFRESFDYRQFRNELVTQWLEVYLADSNEPTSIESSIQEKFPLSLFDYNSTEEFIRDNLDLLVTTIYFQTSKIDARLIKLAHHADIGAKLYSTFLLNYFTRREDDPKEKLVGLNIINSDFLKKNFYSIYENFLLSNNEVSNREFYKKTENMTKFTYFLIDLTESSSNGSKSKSLASILDSNNCSLYVYKILFKLNNKILRAKKQAVNNFDDLLYWLELKRSFIEQVIFGEFQLMFTNNGNPIFLYDFLCMALVNCIKLCTEKLNLIEETEKNENESELNKIFSLCLLVRDFISSVYSIFSLVIQVLSDLNQLTKFDYMLSVVVWHFFDYLNASIQKTSYYELNILDDRNSTLFSSLVDFLTKMSPNSQRFQRQLMFLSNQNELENLLKTNEKGIFMMNLNKLFKAINISSKIDSYNFESELHKCVSSVDFKKSLSNRYVVCYLVSLFVINHRKGPNFDFKENLAALIFNQKDVLKYFIKTVFKKLNNSKANQEDYSSSHNSCKWLVSILVSSLGPSVNLDANLDANLIECFLSINEKRKAYLMNKFNEFNKSNLSNLYSFYYKLVEFLLDSLFQEK